MPNATHESSNLHAFVAVAGPGKLTLFSRGIVRSYHWVISLLQGLGQVMGLDFALVLAAKVKVKVKEER